MKLPDAEKAVNQQAKIVGYLLNPAHRYGASKARFFAQFGCLVEEWQLLALALRDHWQQNEVSKTRETGFGPRYEVESELAAPDGRRPRIRTVWPIDTGQIVPRLISPYPGEVGS